ncbi:hypothetical protein [Microvirga roseola]|uniref:hypothetical protein n=1 Tax=Microvirga roseola TaxID=2883126 RepID=UPI001E4B3187|nr:hypothetical protein [Microvirga roseola]
MRKTFVMAAGFALLATSAWSQGSPYYGGGGGYDRWDRRESGRGWDRGADERRGHHMRHGMRHGMRGDHDGKETGARFFLRNGDRRLGVVCSTQESTEACVNAALRLLNSVEQQGPQQGQGTTQPFSPSPGQSQSFQ